MAPITRSSQHGRSTSQQDNWQISTETDAPGALGTQDQGEGGDVESLEDLTTEESVSGGDSDEGFFQQEQGSLSKSPSGHAEQILQPLQQTADRVSRQVEDFARRLDRFHSARIDKPDDLWREALELLKAYKSTALSRKSQASSDLLQARRQARNRQSSQAVAEEGQVEVQRADKEAELWHLFGILTAFQGPGVRALFARNEKSCVRNLHRYSTDSEVWEAFTSADRIAMEYQQILVWLQKSANASRPSIDDLTESLRTKADRAEGVWSAGWLFTKENIKSQKRNRIWPKPLDPSNPGLENSLRRESDSRRLVAQLDPDAKSREGAALEEADEYHEKGAWVACWELLRRGTSPEAIREWWSERKENWRAISVGGAINTSLEGEHRKWSRLIGLWKMNEWATACFKLCRSGLVGSKHEAAVYGLLCGDLQAPLQVCQTTDDHLFVNLNSFLIERYREFGKFAAQKESRDSFQPAAPKYEEIRRLLQYCQRHERMAQESRDPLNAMQNTMISKDFHLFFLRQGRALARIASYSGQTSPLIVSDGSREINEAAEAVTSDPDGLRLTAHMQLVLKALGFLDSLYTKHEAIVENNVTAYIGWLQQEGKLALIPLYAATLSAERGARVMGAVIMDVTEARERDMVVNLIKKYNMDVSDVLLNQYQLIVVSSGLITQKDPMTVRPVRVTHSVGAGKPRSVKVRADFMGDAFDEEEELLIRCLEWYRYCDEACWPQICRVASAIYKFFISRGRLAAARVLCNRASLSSMSKSVLDIELGDPHFSDNGSGDEEDADMDGAAAEEDQVRLPLSPSKWRRGSRPHSGVMDGEKPGPDRALLTQQARTWQQLEQLIVALDVLETWSEVSEDFEKSKDDANAKQFRDMKKLLQASLNDVGNAIPPLLEADFLSIPAVESERQLLLNIRNHYLPECVLAYNSVLYFSGHALSRNTLVECMNLAQVVATNESLSQAFVQSGRMKELVTALAMDGSAMLHANEQGRAKNSKGQVKRRDGSGGAAGGGMEIWQVRPQDVGLVPDKAVQDILGR